jgi:hypothetical protein
VLYFECGKRFPLISKINYVNFDKEVLVEFLYPVLNDVMPSESFFEYISDKAVPVVSISSYAE